MFCDRRVFSCVFCERQNSFGDWAPQQRTFYVCMSQKAMHDGKLFAVCLCFVHAISYAADCRFRLNIKIMKINRDRLKIESSSRQYTSVSRVHTTNYFYLYILHFHIFPATHSPNSSHLHTLTQFAINYATSRQFSSTT